MKAPEALGSSSRFASVASPHAEYFLRQDQCCSVRSRIDFDICYMFLARHSQE